MDTRGDSTPPELLAEEIAWSVHSHDHQDPSSWGLYFGPFMSIATTSGGTVDSPALTQITPEVLTYWRGRAGQSAHPMMRARYADLLWELARKLPPAKADAAMARVAIDSYLEAIEQRRYEHEVSAVGKGERALDLALRLGDVARVERARDALITLEETIAQDDSPGLWGFCFDRFIEPPNPKVPLLEAQRVRLMADMEARLARFAVAAPSQYHPSGAESAALRLANHYRRLGRRQDVLRVMRAYGGIVTRMQGTAAPLVEAHCLEQLYDQFRTFDMHADADALNAALRIAGEASVADMKEMSVEAQIRPEQIESFYSAMLAGSPDEVLRRVAHHFIPQRQRVEAQLRDLARINPMSFLISRVLKDENGRTIAHIGSLEADLEGNLVSQISQNLQFSIPWLRDTFARGMDSRLLSASSLLDFLFACPVYSPMRRGVLEAGLAAYTHNDALAAIHILVPQVEEALRQLAILIGAPIYVPRRGGGLHARTLDDLLRDRFISQALGVDVTTYLRALLSDLRGWNLRNNVCHGLAPVGMLSMPAADRIVHALLVLALLREQPGSVDSIHSSADDVQSVEGSPSPSEMGASAQ
jgi:hypothetical protein